MTIKRSFRLLFFIVLAAVLVAVDTTPILAQNPATPPLWCSAKHIRFFVGGAEGDAFGSIVLRGAQAAQADLGPTVDYVFSGWDPEKMTEQLRQAIAAKPDGIAMMGHPGDNAIMPLAEEAAKAGIQMEYQNVDVPSVRAKYGGGYIGAQLVPQGAALALEAIRQFGLKSGDKAIVFIPLGQPGRDQRELSTSNTLEKAGLTVIKLDGPPQYASDPNLALPPLTAAVLANPDVKVIVYPGGQMLGAVSVYMEAMSKKPGDIINIGFDTSPAIMQAFDSGYVQLTSDQQPFQQGYLPILSLCGTLVYGFGPLNVDTGAGFVDAHNYKDIATLAKAGLR
jgi:simple sugar transport system substrate-binding protein